MQIATNKDEIALTFDEMRANFEQLTAMTAARICERKDIDAAAAKAIAADAVALVRAKYDGMQATTEQMRKLSTDKMRRAWARTENAALCIAAKHYSETLDIIDGCPFIGHAFLHAADYCEAAARMGVTPQQLWEHTGAGDGSALHDEAQRLYYILTLLILGEYTDATEDDLRQIKPNGIEVDARQITNCIVNSLENKRLRKLREASEVEEKQKRRAARTAAKEDNAGHMPKPAKNYGKLEPDTTVKIYKTMSDIIGNGAQVARINEAGQAGKLAPLWQDIEDAKQTAEKISKDLSYSEDQRERAKELIAGHDAILKVLNALPVVSSIRRPDSSNAKYNGYDFTANEWAQIVTGQKSPNGETVTNVLRATAFIRARSMSYKEEYCRQQKQKDDQTGKPLLDDDGKPIKKTIKKTIITNFQPLTAEFRSEYEDNVLIKDATRVYVQIHKYIDGASSEEFIKDDSGKKLRPKTAARILTLKQHYDFTSAQEIQFKAIILRATRKNEAELIKIVFNTDKRQAEADKRADNAATYAKALADNPDATAAARAEAKKAADKAKQAARELLYDNISTWADKLKQLFAKAYADKLITYYDRRPAKHAVNESKKTKYGNGYVWEWAHPTSDDMKKRKPATKQR